MTVTPNARAIVIGRSVVDMANEEAHVERAGYAVEGTPSVSVVMPTFRRPSFLARAIASVRQQTLRTWELIIVDDNDPASQYRQETEALVAQYADDGRVRYVRHPENRGGGAARNTGIRAARSPFVAFLDDDDEWHPTKLELQMACLDGSADDVALVYCRMRAIDPLTGRERVGSDGRSHGMRDLLIRNTIGSTSCVVCRASALHDVGLFDESLAARQDVDLYVRLAERYAFAFVDAFLVTFHRHDQPSIGDNVNASIEAHERFFEKYRDRIESDPEVLHARLFDLGKLLAWAQRNAEARSVLWRAWRLRPSEYDVIVRFAMTYGLVRALSIPGKRVVRRLLLARDRP